ncbi:DUF4340 domain-containing protein [Patescibacteria group bacterium]
MEEDKKIIEDNNEGTQGDFGINEKQGDEQDNVDNNEPSIKDVQTSDTSIEQEIKVEEENKNEVLEHEAPINENVNHNDQLFNPEMLETDKAGSNSGKLNSTYVLLAIFLVLLLVSYFIKDKSLQNNINSGDEQRIVIDVVKEEIDKIEIISDGKTSIIEKQDNIWKVISDHSFIADQEAVASIIEESLKFNKYIVASENKEKIKIFEVDEEKGVNVKIYCQGEEKANFYVGKPGPDYDSNYVRFANEDIVYLSKGYVGYYFKKEDWRNLTIYNFEAEQVNKAALKYRDVNNNVLMDKIDDKWQINAPYIKEADKSKVETFLNTLAKLKAVDVEYEKTLKDAGFAISPIVVRLELEDGSKRNLLVGGKLDGEDKYYIKREEDNTVYVVNKSIVDNLMKKAEDF